VAAALTFLINKFSPLKNHNLNYNKLITSPSCQS